MSNWTKAKEVIIKNRNNRLSGGFNSIPMGMPRMQLYTPGIQKGNIVIVTANSGIGKSKVTKSLYVLRPIDFLMMHPEVKIKFKTLYFCLEETKDSFMQSMMCYRLYKDRGLRYSIKQLRSQLNPDDPTAVLDADVLDEINAMDYYGERFDEYVTLIDDVKNPYGIYKTCVDYLESVGTYTTKPLTYFDKVSNSMITKEVQDRYIPNHEDTYVQIIIDHVSLLHPEKGQDLFEAIRVLSNNYMVSLRNKFNCSIVMVQQQASDKEKQQYTYKGASIESKLEPSLDGLGDCKLTQRDADEVFGIFAPDRYEIADHRGYDISVLRDNYRSFSFLKTRDGEANLRLGLYFDGCTNYIAELPEAKKMTGIEYDKVLKATGRTIVKTS